MLDSMPDITQVFTPEVIAILFSAANYIIVEFAKRTKADPKTVWGIMCVMVGCIYVTTTFDFTEALIPQIVGKFGLVVLVSTGMWKTVRQLSGREEEAKMELIEHGKNIAKAESQQNVTIVPVHSDVPITVGQPITVQSQVQNDGSVETVNSEVSPVKVVFDSSSQSSELSSEQIENRSL